jgi:SAM-dependent methyltransferase
MQTAVEQTTQQRNQWGQAAAGWERQSEWLDRNMAGLAAWLCTAAGLQPGHEALDIACGAGQPAITAAQRVRPGGRVVAIDLSPEMVAVTERKATRLGLDNLQVREMDAQALAFADESFDAAMCRFGLMFCPDPVRAAAEVRRVLRPGARFALAVWDVPAKNPFFTALHDVLRDFVVLPPPDPTAPGAFRLAPPGELAAVLAAAGFGDIVVESRPMTLTYASLEEYWRIQTDLAAPLRSALASLGPDDIARLKARVFEAAAPNVEGGTVRFAAAALCASPSR